MKTDDLATPFNHLTRGALRAALGVVTLVAAAAMSACGGGEQAEKFAPTTFVVLGDENSALKEMTISSGALQGQKIKGMKYGVNDVEVAKGFDWPLTDPVTSLPVYSVVPTLPTGSTMAWDNSSNYLAGGVTAALNIGTNTKVYAVQRDFTNVTVPLLGGTTALATSISFQYVFSCEQQRLWTQILANSYGLGFADDCPAEKLSGAYSYAAAGHKVADVLAQFQANRAKFGSSTMVAVWAGQNDLIEAYDATVSGTATAQAQKVEEMLARGRALGQTINAITGTGARVVFMTAPALQYSPYVRGANDSGRVARMTHMANLVNEFNRGLTGSQGVVNDGRKSAIVRADDETAAIATAPGNYALTNSDTAWCTSRRDVDGALVPDAIADVNYPLLCNSMTGQTVTSTATPPVTSIVDPYAYMWATDTLIGPAIQAALGGLAYSRAQANPL